MIWRKLPNGDDDRRGVAFDTPTHIAEPPMSLWDVLTKQRGLGSAAFRWNEPPLCRIRLRGDLWQRAAILLAAWGAATGVLLVLFAFNVKPPGISLAIGLGAVFGFGPAMLILFLSRGQVGGRVTIDGEGIRRHRNYASLTLTGMWGEWAEWPYAAIERCVIVPGKALEQSFSVMLLSIDSGWEIVGVPGRTDLQNLAKFLTSRGVTVSQGKSVPAAFLSRYSLPIAGGAAAVGIVFLGGGIGTYLVKAGGPQIAAANRNMPEPEPGFHIADGPKPNDLGPAPHIAPGAPPDAGPFVADGRRPPATAGGGTPTELIGGNGGTPFRSANSDQRPMAGVRYTIGNWAGKDRVGRVEPLFDRDDSAGEGVVMARDGYVVGGIEVDALEFVDAMALVFVRVAPGGELDLADTYTSDWIGKPSGRPPRTLSGGGKKVIGLHGRGAAILDSVGLVLER